MKKSKIIIVVGIIIVCVIAGIMAVKTFNKPKKNYNWDITIYEYWNDPLAGRRKHEKRKLLIDSSNHVGKITYVDEELKEKETKVFDISKNSINKILELAEKGDNTKEMKGEEAYTVFRIELSTKNVYIDSKDDTDKVISSLFID